MKVYNLVVTNIDWPHIEVRQCDWYCDRCGAYLNDQAGFEYSYNSGHCVCEKCGFQNDIVESNITDNKLPCEEEIFDVEWDDDNTDFQEFVFEYLDIKYGKRPYSFNVHWTCVS